MDVFDAIANRRSAKRFTERPVRREEIERILDAAVLAPNHRMTEPWGFAVLGPRSQRAYAELRAGTKAAKIEDEEAAAAVRAKVIEDTMNVPCIIAVTAHLAEEPITRDEDYAATFMAIQNLLLAATALGLGTHVRTGRLLERAELRAVVEAPRNHRVVALIYLGEPAELPAPKDRTPAAAKTRWLP